ncbi:GNAT family N-acetyltransferase [Rhodococcus erythropolis]|uniref:GNAT family N-acetyltransferase n=1 Tax=Rhodococcus erythropolis TaxID=1833 RepID=UPI0039825A72
MLGEAFENDPVMRWLFPRDNGRRESVSRLFAAFTNYHHLAHGGVDVAVDINQAIGGTALWDPPGRWRQSRGSTWRMKPAWIRALGLRSRAANDLYNALDAVHPDEPHWYLAAIGTAAPVRGAGYAKKLLHSRLDRCDRERHAAYLESSNVANIPYYEVFGFAVSHEIVVPHGCPSLYGMWRLPR